MNYEQFIESKKMTDTPTGLKEIGAINPMLRDFQRDIVKWALKRGRACVWADCGLGKTPMQLECAKHIPDRVLIFAPLAVSQQTIREGVKFGVHVEYAREEDDERHICPLQLEVIRRAIKLWSNKGDVVLSPFTGIGSEGFVALEQGRKFIGAELKESYYEQARKNLIEVEARASEGMLL